MKFEHRLLLACIGLSTLAIVLYFSKSTSFCWQPRWTCTWVGGRGWWRGRWRRGWARRRWGYQAPAWTPAEPDSLLRMIWAQWVNETISLLVIIICRIHNSPPVWLRLRLVGQIQCILSLAWCDLVLAKKNVALRVIFSSIEVANPSSYFKTVQNMEGFWIFILCNQMLHPKVNWTKDRESL